MAIDAEIFNKIQQTAFNSMLKGLYTMNKQDLFLTWKDSSTDQKGSTPYQQKEEYPHDHLNWAEKESDKNSTPFHDKNIQTRNRRKLQQNKSCMWKPTEITIFNGSWLKAFPLIAGPRQGYPLSAFLLNTVFKVHSDQLG